MADMKEPSTPDPRIPTNFGQELRFRSILLSAANVISATGFMVGAGFFTLLLLTGMNIALQRSTMEGFWMMMGLAMLMSTLISLLTYNITAKVIHFKEKIFEQALPSIPLADLLAMQVEIQKQQEILMALQKELSKNIHKDDHSSGN